MKIKININSLKKESNHLDSVDLVRLIKPNEIDGKVATMNYAWLEIDKTLDPHSHSDGSEFYLFLKGKGKMLVNKDWFEVTPGDFITVSKGLNHSLKNIKKESLEFITLRVIE